MFKKILRISFALSCLSLGAIPETFASHKCKSGYVERAGVALVKRYANSNPGLEYAVLVGIDAHKTHPLNNAIPYVNFFGGKCDPTDKYSTDAAVRELFEETSGAVKMKASNLNYKNPGYLGYVYTGDFKPHGSDTIGKNYTQLFFVRDDAVSVAAITKIQAAAQKNKKLPHHMREAKATCAIPLQDMLNAARKIHALEAKGDYKGAKSKALYTFNTRGDGKGGGRTTVYLDSQYLRNVARDLKTFEVICFKVSNGAVK